MAIGRGWGMPTWITGHMGICPTCGRGMLIFELKDAKGTYYHCWICDKDFEVLEREQ